MMEYIKQVCCFRGHNKQETTLVHPVTKETAIQAEAIQSPPQQTQRPEDSGNHGSNVAVPNMEVKKSPRKRVTGGNLRPPTVKRSNQAPVTMQGWLWKQGSDGFMRWKKRWFVLADFCLFYYKGPDEEKILGSILLPSYKISPCSNEGRVLRKFAFKLELLFPPNPQLSTAEHQNMRTYYFAADSKESAQQWMNAMSLASILQRDPSLSDRHDPSHRSDSHNTSTANEDEDSGFTSYHSRRYLGSPQHDGNSTLNGSFASDPGGRLRADELHRDTASDSSHAPNERLVDGYLGSADKYPTSYTGPHPHFYNRNPNNPGGNGRPPAGYTNPPPKPKRLANQEVYGPSGGQHPQPSEQHQYIDGQPMEYPDYREEYPQYTGHPNEGMGVYANPQVMMAGDGGKYRVGHPQIAHPQEWVPQYEVYPGDYPNYPTHVQQPSQVYHGNHRGHTGRSEQANGSSQPSNDPPAYRDEYDPAVLREKGQRLYLAQRPHSANFLEYDHNPEEIYRAQDPSSMVRRPRSTKGNTAPTRPKSSIEQYDPDEYWSEQSNPAVTSNPNPNYPQPQTQPHQVPHTPHTQNIPHSWDTAQNNPTAGHDTSFESYSSSQGEGAARSPRGNNGGNSYPTPSESNGHGQRDEPYRDGYPSEGKAANRSQAPANQSRTLPRDAQFLRSASARLPSSHEMVGLPPYSRDDSLADNDPRRIQQREESMKRLLEWKQRMLQSPLTKKYPHQKSPQFPMATGIVNHPIPPVKKPEAEEYRKQVLQELANNEANKLNQGPIAPHMSRIANQERSPQIQRASGQPPPKRDGEGTNGTTNQFPQKGPSPASNGSMVRSADNKHLMTTTLNRYRNSYSSDDEESGSGSLKGLFISRTQPRQHGQRGKNELLRDDLNMSDSELQVRGKLQNAKIRKYVHHPDSIDGGGSNSPRLSISAGDLLGKTHEELILLLIQLRRTQAKLQKAIDTCQMELEGEKKLLLIDTKNRDLHSMKVEELSKQLEEYAKQFDLSKPMVNLVDNMVKLGSLYGGSEQVLTSQYRLNELTPEQYAPPKKMIEFTRRLQEQRLLKEERLEWSQLVPDQADLQGKLQQLYQLDRSLQEESINLTNLHQEKDMLERALLGIQAKANESGENVVEQERLLKQQRLVERELGKVHVQLVHTTKKLEETAAENAHIEHEILLLRQKIQQTLKMASAANPNISSLSVDDVETTELKLQLEEELAHVQNIMDELGKRRQEISGAVEQLKDKGHQVRPSPTGVAGSAPLPGRKFHRSTYLETDLDTMVTRDILDVSSQSDEGSPIPTYLPHAHQRSSQVPLYVNTNALNNKTNGVYALTGMSSDYPPPPAPDDYHDAGDQEDLYGRQDINEADDRMKRFYGIIPREKPAEIKTVRIVKRESERRNKSKDRKKVSYDEQLLSKVIEEPDALLFEDFDYYEGDYQSNEFQRSMSLPRNYGRATYLPASMQEGIPVMPPNSLPLTNSAAVSTTAVTTTTVTTTKILPNVPYYYRTPSLTSSDRAPTAHERLFGSGIPPLGSVPQTPDSPSSASPLATPVFKSEAARQIVAETAQQLMASLTSDPLQLSLEASPGGDTGSLKRRHKRRHYTISSSQPVALEAAPPKLVHARSRDDLDIERCLRSANTPDVVKSTIKKSDNFDESTIDRELGLPQKIVIPERYIEQEEEEPLSAEEKLHRIQKTESIRKMLSESTTYGDLSENEIANVPETLKKKYEQEKKQREQLLSLNQLLAQEVKERSKAVAAHIPPRSTP